MRHQELSPLRSGEAGVSLAAVIVALGVAGIGVYAVMTFMGQHSRAQWETERRNEVTEIRNMLRKQIDCDSTTAGVAITCVEKNPASEDFVELRGRSTETTAAPILVRRPDDPTRKRIAGRVELRAWCHVSKDIRRLRVEYRTVNKDGQVLENRLREGERLDWQDLFDDVPLKCRVPKTSDG